MKDKENKVIVDSQGNAFKNTKDNKLKAFLEANIWNLLSVGLAVCTALSGMVNWVISKSFSISCENFYGISRKYFSGTEIFEDKLIFILCALVLFIYPFLFSYVNKKINSKLYVAATFLMTIYILFAQNILYTVDIIDIVYWDWLKSYINNYVAIGIFLVSDIVIAYFIIIRDYFWGKKKYSKCETVILTTALLLYVSSAALGISVKMNYKISDKKAYEVIEQDRAIIENYDGKFVVMDCEIQNETIILNKGTYSLEEMTGVSITYHEYETVICK